ncbi:alpha/beta hydrolase family protein [Niabella aquatica]
MLRYLFIALSTVLFLTVYGQSITGHWAGELDIQGAKLPLVLHITQKGTAFTSTMDSPAQGVRGMKVDTTELVNDRLTLVVNNIQLRYVGTMVSGDSIAGIFTQMTTSLPLRLTRTKDSLPVYNRPQTPHPPFSYKIEEIVLRNQDEGNLLAGTLTTPSNKKNFPVVVMITGSGAQDRDGTLFGHKPFLVIADHLANNGIGSLRLDDRNVGGSEAGKDGPTTADFVTDINSAVHYLARRGFKHIGLLGHSEGGMIAPLVANNNKKVQFIISMAGPGVPVDTLMKKQLDVALKLGNVPEAAADINKAIVNEAYSFNNNYTGNHLKTDLEQHLAQKFPLVQDMSKAVAAQVGTSWFSYFAKQNPQIAIEKIKIPVLAINGSLDFQVDALLNLAGWKTSLERAGNKNFEVTELPGLNHLFQQAKTGAASEYATIEETISPTVLQLITGWILKISKQLK